MRRRGQVGNGIVNKRDAKVERSKGYVVGGRGNVAYLSSGHIEGILSLSRFGN